MINSLALAICTTVIALIAVDLRRSWRSGSLASPYALFAILTGLHFLLPAWLGLLGIAPALVNPANEEYLPWAALYASAALLSFKFGHIHSSVVRRNTIDFSPRQSEYLWTDHSIFVLIAVLLAIGWAARVVVFNSNSYLQIARTSQGELEGPFYAFIMLAEGLPLYAIAVATIRRCRDESRPSKLWTTIQASLVIMDLLYWLPTGRKEPVLLAIMVPAILKYIRTGRRPTRSAVGMFSLFVVALFVTTSIYRYAIEVTLSPGEQLSAEKMLNSALAQDRVDELNPFETVYARMSLIESLAGCIRMIANDLWPVMWGESYTNAVTGLVPRFLWPEKPEMSYGNRFGYAVGLINPADERTSISVTVFGESYLNFGAMGITVVGALGYALGLLYSKTTSSCRRETWILIYGISLPMILYIGGTFAIYYGVLLKIIPIIYVTGRLMESPQPHGI